VYSWTSLGVFHPSTCLPGSCAASICPASRAPESLSPWCGRRVERGLMRPDMEIMFAFSFSECYRLSWNSAWQFLTTRQLSASAPLLLSRCGTDASLLVLWLCSRPPDCRRQMPGPARSLFEHRCHCPALSSTHDLYCKQGFEIRYKWACVGPVAPKKWLAESSMHLCRFCQAVQRKRETAFGKEKNK